MDFATDPLGRPLDLPLPFGAVQSMILEPSVLRNPDKSIWIPRLLLPLLEMSPVNAAWDAEDDDESSNAVPSEEQPLSLSAMATLVQVRSAWRYKYLFPLFFSKTNLIWIFGSTDWNFGVVEIDSEWRIILEQERKNIIIFVLFCSWAELYEERDSYDYESTLATHFKKYNDYE